MLSHGARGIRTAYELVEFESHADEFPARIRAIKDGKICDPCREISTILEHYHTLTHRDAFKRLEHGTGFGENDCGRMELLARSSIGEVLCNTIEWWCAMVAEGSGARKFIGKHIAGSGTPI